MLPSSLSTTDRRRSMRPSVSSPPTAKTPTRRGQSLIPMMKLRFASPAHLIDVNRLPGLDCIEERDGTLRIGALVRHNHLAACRCSSSRSWLRRSRTSRGSRPCACSAPRSPRSWRSPRSSSRCSSRGSSSPSCRRPSSSSVGAHRRRARGRPRGRGAALPGPTPSARADVTSPLVTDFAARASVP